MNPDISPRATRQRIRWRVAIVGTAEPFYIVMANIEQLLQNGGSQTLLIVSVADLTEFGRAIVEKASCRQPTEVRAEEDEKLTARQVRERYNISSVTIWRWEQKHYLVPCGKVGNRRLFSKVEVERALRYGIKS